MVSMRFLVAFALAGAVHAKVVINEISYHPPDDHDALEFIELHNTADQPADVAGWKFTKGLKFQFPDGAQIPAKGFFVVARDAAVFKKVYGIVPAGTFSSSLKNSGENIELSDAAGNRIDRVSYKDDPPWPLSPDGETATLERICPDAPGEDPANWAASPLSKDSAKPAGTPGKQNANYAATLPPVITRVTFEPEKPNSGQPVNITAALKDGTDLQSVELVYRVVTSGSHKPEQRIAMKPQAGGATQFVASIPAQPENSLVRFRVEAVNRAGSRRVEPGANEPRPAYSYLVPARLSPVKIARAYLIHADEADYKRAQRYRPAGGQGMGMMNQADQERFGAIRMFEQGSEFSSIWTDLVFTQKVSHAQLTKLRETARTQLEARDEALQKIEESDEPMKDAQQLLLSFQNKIQEGFAPVLEERQRAALKPARGQQRQTPEMVLQRFCNVEGAFFYLTTHTDQSEANFSKAKDAFAHWTAERAKLVTAISDVMLGKGDQAKAFEQMQNLNAEIDKAFTEILPEDDRAAFAEWREKNSPFRFRPPGAGGSDTSSARGGNAFVYVPPNSTQPELYDFVEIKPRNAGYKVHFAKRNAFQEMSAINLLFEYNDRFVLAEALASDVYHRAGNAAPQTDFIRLHIDGRPFGYHVMVEQPNRAFLKRNKLRDDGNLYKILWYEQSVKGQHEKKTNPHTGHDDLLALLDALKKSTGDEQWAVIKKNFDVEQVINYFAVNMVLSHWDGYFNNYFTYHDVNGSGKWTMYPWDQDKTWGFHDASGDTVFYDMPITYGMEGDRPPWQPEGPPPQGFRGNHWWRAGGVFSKPLLANPQFRKHFLARTREILETVYTEKEFFPVIDKLKNDLGEDVRLRAEVMNEKSEEALARFDTNLQSLKEHLVKRREFLLAQDEIKSAGKFDRAAVK